MCYWLTIVKYFIHVTVSILISKNYKEAGAVIYTVGSVVGHRRYVWAFTARSSGQNNPGSQRWLHYTTSSLTMEVMAVTKAFVWLKTQDHASVCILSDSTSMIWKVQAGSVCRKWLEFNDSQGHLHLCPWDYRRPGK